MNTFCTIITPDYHHYAAALLDSIIESGSSVKKMYALVAVFEKECTEKLIQKEGLEYIFLDELCAEGIGKAIKDKYWANHIDEFRWSMKPVLINWLIQKQGFEKVIYLDSDLYFYSNPDFLFDELDTNKVLLSPHWRSSDPRKDVSNFLLLYTDGLFNGGFMAANKNATHIMDWWAETCVFICVKDRAIGQFDDQGHLNLLPIYFDGVGILKNRGCNVANWNIVECERQKQPDGSVLINGESPVVFIHFTGSMIRGVLSGQDESMRPYLEKFNRTLASYKAGFDIINKYLKIIEEETIQRNIRIKKEHLRSMGYVLRLKIFLKDQFSRIA